MADRDYDLMLIRRMMDRLNRGGEYSANDLAGELSEPVERVFRALGRLWDAELVKQVREDDDHLNEPFSITDTGREYVRIMAAKADDTTAELYPIPVVVWVRAGGYDDHGAATTAAAAVWRALGVELEHDGRPVIVTSVTAEAPECPPRE